MLDHLTIVPILLFSVIIHEVAHGWMALYLGDPTARESGRLTLNPVPHIDLFGSIIIPLFSLVSVGRVMIAWAKPVPINPANFSHVRRDDILVSIVGPLSNFVLALFCTIAFIVIGIFARPMLESQTQMTEPLKFLLEMFWGGITLNVVLAIFNMLPIPPLDGSHVLASALPPQLGYQYRRIGFAGIFIILLLMRWAPFERLFDGLIGAFIYPFHSLIALFLG